MINNIKGKLMNFLNNNTFGRAFLSIRNEGNIMNFQNNISQFDNTFLIYEKKKEYSKFLSPFKQEPNFK